MRAFSYARGHFWSRDKDGGHIRSPYPKTPCYMQTLCLYVCRNGVYADRFFYIVEVSILDHFCSCDLDLNPMTFIYELDPYPGCAKIEN